MEKNTVTTIIGLILSTILFSITVVPKGYKLFRKWNSSNRVELRAKRYEELMGKAKKSMDEQKWSEAERLYAEAGHVLESPESKVGLARAILKTSNAETAIDALLGCEESLCEEERNELYTIAFQESLKKENSEKEMEKRWNYGTHLYTPACTVEKMYLPLLKLASNQRKEISHKIENLVETRLKKSMENTIEMLKHSGTDPRNPGANLLQGEISRLGAERTLKAIIILGKKGGTSIGKDSHTIESGNCDKLESTWEEGSDDLDRARDYELAIRSSMSNPENRDTMSGIREEHIRREYENNLHTLFQLSAARSYISALQKRCQNGCASKPAPLSGNPIRGLSPEGLFITSVECEDSQASIYGKALSRSRISAYLRALEKAGLTPKLKESREEFRDEIPDENIKFAISVTEKKETPLCGR